MGDYRRVYRMLTKYGHSPVKALEMIIDARRRDKFALSWIRFVRRARHG